MKRFLFVTLAVCSTALAIASSSQAANPGSQPGPAARRFNAFEHPLPGIEVTTVPIPFAGLVPVADGFVVLTEPGAPAGCPGWSDFIVFHNGANLPNGGNATFLTMISDPDPGDPREPDLPFNCGDGTVPLLNDPATGLVRPAYASAPAFLLTLTANQVLAGAGANATVTLVETPGFVHSNGALPYIPDANTSYFIFSEMSAQVPALPPWAFGLLAVTLLGTAVLVVRRRGRYLDSAAV